MMMLTLPTTEGGQTPDRAVTVLHPKTAVKKPIKNPVVIGAYLKPSLRRIAHYDYWSD